MHLSQVAFSGRKHGQAAAPSVGDPGCQVIGDSQESRPVLVAYAGFYATVARKINISG